MTNPSLLLEKLPPELIRVIISYLSAPDLACIGATCRSLAAHASDDLLWADLINARLPNQIKDPGIFASFRRLYLAYHPCWFIPQHKIWFADNEPTGILILTRYNKRRGVIEGYQMVAERGNPEFYFWKAEPAEPAEPAVLVQSFDPIVRLLLDDPTLFLKDPDPSCLAAPIQRFSQSEERHMPLALEAHHVYSSLSFCSAISNNQESLTDGEMCWPPQIIPSNARTSRHTGGHQPERIKRMSDMSESSFRINKWTSFRVAFSPGRSQLHSTFSTLDPDFYNPTTKKPYQGIWVGDYSAHGCEFLLVLQKDVDEDLSEESRSIDVSNGEDGPEVDDMIDLGQRGRLEGIKLTGDMNVPRGQYSWVAEDIGPGGLVGVAVEEPFIGARMVRCKGHVAGIGFQDGEYSYY
ncbi:uncharacterized protein N7529_005720 [Penicillium soppii]|uniref:uncharacterized protein n=1 Tax=Penicillium soppii TaxID=69789 RepID=UPI0025498A98|nr:uncharacterized protein N7529_005720 [Penicillium soppii]KAJ5863804.1 hypothetical protein N7529_005720 [Penicillium soppii]